MSSGLEAMPTPYQGNAMDEVRRAAEAANRVDLLHVPGGQVAGMLSEQRNNVPAKEIVERMVSEAAQILERYAQPIRRSVKIEKDFSLPLEMTALLQKGRFERRAMSGEFLKGFRALDLTDLSGQLCGRLLADLGMEVIKIEPPGGDPVRNLAPFVKSADGKLLSTTFAHLNAGKASKVLDLETDAGRARCANWWKPRTW